MASSERWDAIFDGGTALGLGTGELLDRFADRGDEAAFAALVARHGPMVLATCRRILPDTHDADDAFQATFLVLARRAGTISDPDRLAPWLHGVARRVAVRSRALAARRRALEGTGDVASLAATPAADRDDLRAILDEELARLPPKYRDPLVLCYLEGLTHDQAAGQLAWPVGTVRSRLAGGRDLLRSRLARRGFGPSAALPPSLPLAIVARPLAASTCPRRPDRPSPPLLRESSARCSSPNSKSPSASPARRPSSSPGRPASSAPRGQIRRPGHARKPRPLPSRSHPILPGPLPPSPTRTL